MGLNHAIRLRVAVPSGCCNPVLPDTQTHRVFRCLLLLLVKLFSLGAGLAANSSRGCRPCLITVKPDLARRIWWAGVVAHDGPATPRPGHFSSSSTAHLPVRPPACKTRTSRQSNDTAPTPKGLRLARLLNSEFVPRVGFSWDRSP